MAKNSLMNIGPPDSGKMGVGIIPMQQENKFGIGVGNGNDVSINGKICDLIWNAILEIYEECIPVPIYPGCGTGADFMVSEGEIIL